MAQLVFDDVSVRYHTMSGETLAVDRASFAVESGEIVALLGPSGCGKSTLLSCAAGLFRPSAGAVRVDGVPVSGPTPKVGYMLQQDHLLEWRTVLGNVLLGPEIRRADLRAARQRALNLLEKYGLGDFVRHYPHQLSGGMRQRVALVRTLMLDPEFLLLDEPLSALDYQTRLHMQGDLVRIFRQEGRAVLMVTHDLAEAIAMADRVVVLSRRPARVKAEVRLEFGRPGLDPLERRRQPEFGRYFNQIWGLLDVPEGRTAG
ncbi:MAG: ABC transporter ATP-binding protein [Clostridia bacterium]|nr:ABC transporter ATP-binding protein [Clostridia bacterium]